MTTTEFERWVKQGLGRAVTRLRAEEDKSPFREIVLQVAVRQEGYYTSGEYAYDLINCYDDTSLLVEAAIKNAVSSHTEGRTIHIGNEQLLAKFYSNGNAAAGDKLEEFYTNIFADVSARTSKTESENNSLFSYINISFTLAEIKDEKRLRDILIDMGTLYDKKELFDDSHESFLTFYNHAHYKFIAALEAALADIRAEKSGYFPLGDYFDKLASTNFRKPASGEGIKAPTVTFEELYELVKNASDKIDRQYYELLDKLTDEQKIKLALVVKNETDPKRLVNIIWIFTHTSNPWPLDPAILINSLRKYEQHFNSKKYDSIEKMLSSGLIHVLSNLRSDAVRDYALDLIKRGYLDEGAALWAKSIHPEDWDEFTQVLKKLNFCGFYSNPALINTLSMEKLNETEADISKTEKSAELLKYMYENSYDRVIRHYTVLELRRRGLLTDEMKNECRYDDFPPIRQIFSNNI